MSKITQIQRILMISMLLMNELKLSLVKRQLVSLKQRIRFQIQLGLRLKQIGEILSIPVILNLIKVQVHFIKLILHV